MDATTLETDGPETTWWTWKENKEAFASPSSVCLLIDDTAPGPEPGVNDHACKLPSSCEPAACVKVSSTKHK